MRDMLIALYITGSLFGILFFLPRCNRRRSVWGYSGISLLLTMLACAFIAFAYQSGSSVFGYVLRHNHGLLGGYLCTLFFLLAHAAWLFLITRHNRKFEK